MYTSIDLIEEFAAEYLLSSPTCTPQALLSTTVARYAESQALHVAFALVSLAAHLEDPVVSLDIDGIQLARALYRCVSAFTADICAVSHLSVSHPTCADIAAFWSTSQDTFFPPPLPTDDVIFS